MRILIDFQGAQTASRFRDLGRYCLALQKKLQGRLDPMIFDWIKVNSGWLVQPAVL